MAQTNEAPIIMGIRMDRRTHARLRYIAEDEHRKLSQEVRRLIDERIEQWEMDHGQIPEGLLDD